MSISSARSTLRPFRSAFLIRAASRSLFSTARRNSSSMVAAERGFARKLFTPTCTASSSMASQLYAVRIMMADSPFKIVRISFVVFRPSMSGIFQSTRIRSYGSQRAWRRRTISTASAPEAARSETTPTLSKISLECSRAIGSSSMSSTFRPWSWKSFPSVSEA